MALQTFSGKVSPEVAEQFKAAQENSEAMTFNAFMELLLEAYLNPKTKTVEVVRPSADQLQEIQLKDNEIGRIKSAYDLKAAEVEALGEDSRLLSKQLSETKMELIETLECGANIPLEAAGTIKITIPPIMNIVLDCEQEVAKKKSGKDFSYGDLLINNFWESIVNGVSYPFRIWSRAELANLANQIKEIEPQP